MSDPHLTCRFSHLYDVEIMTFFGVEAKISSSSYPFIKITRTALPCPQTHVGHSFISLLNLKIKTMPRAK